MKVIGFYNKHNNDFYGYVCLNEYAILKDIENVSKFNEKTSWVKKHGQTVLSNLFKLMDHGADQYLYIMEIFNWSGIKDIDIRVTDYKYELRKLKLNKLKLKQNERKN